MGRFGKCGHRDRHVFDRLDDPGPNSLCRGSPHCGSMVAPISALRRFLWVKPLRVVKWVVEPQRTPQNATSRGTLRPIHDEHTSNVTQLGARRLVPSHLATPDSQPVFIEATKRSQLPPSPTAGHSARLTRSATSVRLGGSSRSISRFFPLGGPEWHRHW